MRPTQETIDSVLSEIDGLIEQTGLACEFSKRDVVIGDTRRYHFERLLRKGGARYMQITPLHPEDAWEFLIMAGQGSDDGSVKPVEGRRGGDAAYVVEFFRRWVIALDRWNDIPR